MIKFVYSMNTLVKNNSIVRTNRDAEIGSPCLAPRSRRKYVLLWPPLFSQESWFVNKTLIQSIKFSPNRIRTAVTDLWFNESKAFFEIYCQETTIYFFVNHRL